MPLMFQTVLLPFGLWRNRNIHTLSQLENMLHVTTSKKRKKKKKKQ